MTARASYWICRIGSSRFGWSPPATGCTCSTKDGRTPPPCPTNAVEDVDAGSTLAHVTAPLPGKVVKVAVRSGETVERGATLVVLEAMKMELSVDAPREGIIDEVTVAEGEQVVESAVLVTFAAAGE